MTEGPARPDPPAGQQPGSEQPAGTGQPPAPGQPTAPVPPATPVQPAAPPHWPTWRRGQAPDPWEVWLRRAEHATLGHVSGVQVPAWLRSTRGERRWPITLSVIAAIVLQMALPPQFIQPFPRYLIPGLEAALLIGLSIADPVRVERGGTAIRIATIMQIVLITIANTASAALLIRAILIGRTGSDAVALFGSGISIWITNVIAFGLWYWEFDRGGPVQRTAGSSRFPDLMFPQMASPQLAPAEWEPQFVDYLYLSFTNATAFSPTDVMPLARWAKLTMLVQSAVSLAIGALVIARAVNVLRT